MYFVLLKNLLFKILEYSEVLGGSTPDVLLALTVEQFNIVLKLE
jgi:hypothetical protein